MNIQDYEEFRQRLEVDFRDNSTRYITGMDIMRAGILPDDAHDEINRTIMLAAQKWLKISCKQFQAALRQWAKELVKQDAEAEKAERQQAYANAVAESFGAALPTNAREAVARYCAHNQITVQFNHDCLESGKPIDPDKPIEDRILLTAEGLGLTFGDAKVMTPGGVKIAWAEYVADRRTERRQAVWSALERADPVASAKALRQLRDLCERLFQEPAYADAAIRKFIWQVKRRMIGLYIEHLQFLVFGGGQGTGKTELARCLIKPMEELSCESSMDQVADDKNFSLRSMFVVFVDELAKADRADMNKLKTMVTGKSNTSRRMYSHTAQKVTINMTLLGTADKRVRQIVSDVAGMRRFVEVMTIPKHQSQRFDWQTEVEQFPWLDLWKAVDHTTDDPLMTPYGDLVRAKQEDMRGRDNVESWLENFDAEPKRIKLLNPKIYAEGKFIEIWAENLYTGSFRAFENAFHPGSTSTSIASWGNTFKAMIEAGKIPLWSWRKIGNKVCYRLELNHDNVVELHPAAREMVVK